MAGQRVEVQRDIIAEAGEVWTVLTDLERAPKVMRSIESVERLEGAGYDVGVRWRETRRMFGRLETEEMQVSMVDPPRRTVIQSEVKGTVFRTEFSLHPSSVGTRLRVEFTAESADASTGRRFAAAMLGLMGGKAMKRALEEDLEDIARAVESRR